MADEKNQNDCLIELHNRIVGGDRTAIADLCRAAYEPLRRYLMVKFPKLDDHLRQEAVAKALLEHGKTPTRYDPAAGASLKYYLEIIAWRRADNLWHRERRRSKRERRAAEEKQKTSVAVDPLAGNMVSEEIERYLQLLSDENDRRFARLLADGISEPRQLGDALGLPELPPDKLQTAVKRARDRIRQTFRRKGPTL